MTDQRTATQAFIDAKQEIDALLAQMKDLSEENFDIDPQQADWAHVGDLQRTKALLDEAADFLASRE